MKGNYTRRIAMAAAMAGLSGPLLADDTEIYMASDGSSAAPLVMFHLEYTSNLVSTICTGVTAQDAATLQTQCSQMVPLAGYFAVDDIADGTITSFEMLRAALKKVLAPLGNIKVGFMLAHADNNKCDGPDSDNDCSNGGYILKGLTPLSIPTGFSRENPDSEAIEALLAADAGKAAVFSTLDALPEPQGNLAHPNQNKEVYFELFRYLTGQAVHNGHNGWADFGTNTAYNLGSASDNITPSGAISDTVPDGTVGLQWDSAIEDGTNYVSPLTQDCTKVFVVNILDGGGNANNGSDAEIEASLSSGGMALNVSNGDKGFVEVVRWLHDKDLADGTINGLDLSDRQTVTSFFIAKQPQQVDDAAVAGGTGYALEITEDATEMVKTLDSVFNQILSVSTTFVSASIPVNVFNRSEVLDNVFIALFQANADAQPQWAGNVKKLKLSVATLTTTEGTTENDLRIVDVNDDPAISPLDGRINYDALTFWTDPNGFDVQQADTTQNEVAGADGRTVNRGGAGQRIPGFLTDTPSLTNSVGTRTLYTDIGGALVALNADAATAAQLWPELSDNSTGNWNTSLDSPEGLDWSTAGSKYWRDGVTLQDEAIRVLKFARGMDVNDADGDGSTTDGRRWQFGDPLHSRPLPVNYGGSATSPDIRLIVGSNDGFIRMVRNTNGDAEDGSELWAFMPRTVLPIQKELMDNAARGSHPYGVDGAPVAYIEDLDNDGTPNKVWLYFGLRRGGRAYYALDITNPDAPTLMWTITKADLPELGLTFSTPQVKMLNWSGEPQPVLIFGGGYDIGKDESGIGTNDDEGNAFYVIDAETGGLVWKAVKGDNAISLSADTYTHPGLLDGIPSRVTAVDTNGDGLVDRAYVGDTGGVLWRADLAGSTRTNWKMTPVLSVGRHFNPTVASEDRRFFHAPDVVLSRDDTGAFDGVVIGSGNRAHPLDTAVTDWVYLFKDRQIVSGGTLSTSLEHDDLADITDDCLQTDSCITTPNLSNGWRLQLEDDGEKLLSSPMTLSGVIYFNSYVPRGGTDGVTCGPAEGTGYFYAVDFQDGRAVFNYDTTNDITDADGNTTDLFKSDRRRQLLSGGIPSDNVYVPFTDPANGQSVTCILAPDFTCEGDGQRAAWRTFWYESE